MSRPATDDRPSNCDFLLIGRGNGGRTGLGHTETWLSELFSSSYQLEQVPDVYLGLARLCAWVRPAAASASAPCLPRAVLVELNDLDDSEFEFFLLARQIAQGTPVYLLGARPGDPRLARAIQNGARGSLDSATLRSLVSNPPLVEPTDSSDRSDARVAAPETTPSSPSGAAIPSSPPVSPKPIPTGPPNIKNTIDETDETFSSADAAEHPHVAPPVRVPWLRYPDRPRRTGPASGGSKGPAPSQPPTGDRDEDHPTRPRSDYDDVRRFEPDPSGEESLDLEWRAEADGDLTNEEAIFPPSSAPLLTEEELRALIGEDMVSFNDLDDDPSPGPSRPEEHRR